MFKRNILCILCFTCLNFSCEKRNIEDSGELFAKIQIDDNTIFYNANDSIYSDYHFQSSKLGLYQYGGGFINSSYKIENDYGTSYDRFSIAFQNIPFDSIKPGLYEIVGKKDNLTYCNEGIEIIWMNPDTWVYLEELYMKNEDFLNCVEANPNYNCLNKIGPYTFLTTLYANNNSKVEITKSYLKEYETYFFSDSTYRTINDLIVEGKLTNCNIGSFIDESIIKKLSGEFRIHIPAPKPLYTW